MKSKFAVVLLLVLSTLIFSCKERMCCTVIDNSIDVYVKDKSGNNLLNPATQGAYNVNDIKLFEVKNGSKVQMMGNNIRYTVLKETNNNSFVRIFAEEPSGNGEVTKTSYIQWKENDEDVIESTVSKNKDTSHCTKVKCNGNVKYDSQTASTRRVVEIIK